MNQREAGNLLGVGADPCVGPGADTRVRPYVTGSGHESAVPR